MAAQSEEKEKFSVGLNDRDLLKQIEVWEEESTSLYEELEKIRDQNLDYYHGIQTDVERIHGKMSKAVENRIWMATETMIPIATARLPEIEIT